MTNTTDRDEMKPCPFCGERNIHLQDAAMGHSTTSCDDCGCEGPSAANDDEAIAAWNRRATPTPQAGDALTASGNDVLRETEWQEDGKTPWEVLSLAQQVERVATVLEDPTDSSMKPDETWLSEWLRTLKPALSTTPTMSAEEMREAAAKGILTYLFEACQPDRGDVFSWCDDHAEAIAEAAIRSLPLTKEPSQANHEGTEG